MVDHMLGQGPVPARAGAGGATSTWLYLGLTGVVVVGDGMLRPGAGGATYTWLNLGITGVVVVGDGMLRPGPGAGVGATSTWLYLGLTGEGEVLTAR